MCNSRSFSGLLVSVVLAGCAAAEEGQPLADTTDVLELTAGTFRRLGTLDDLSEVRRQLAGSVREAPAAGSDGTVVEGDPEKVVRELTPIAVRGRDLYIGRELDSGRVREALSARARQPGYEPSPANDAPTSFDKLAWIFGTDDRVVVRANTTFPWSAQVFVHTPKGCSATMLGPNTALTAAHCFASSGQSVEFAAPGYDSMDSNPAPYGWGASSCTVAFVPQGWFTSNFDAFYDFAVIDFSSCTSSTGWGIGYQSGWLGWWSDAPVQNFAVQTFGYPDTCPGNFAYPQLCGMSVPAGSVTAGPSAGLLRDQRLDLVEGASGSGLSVWDGAYYVVGTATRSRQQGQTRLNVHRRFDGTVFAFLQEATDDF